MALTESGSQSQLGLVMEPLGCFVWIICLALTVVLVGWCYRATDERNTVCGLRWGAAVTVLDSIHVAGDCGGTGQKRSK